MMWATISAIVNSADTVGGKINLPKDSTDASRGRHRKLYLTNNYFAVVDTSSTKVIFGRRKKPSFRPAQKQQ